MLSALAIFLEAFCDAFRTRTDLLAENAALPLGRAAETRHAAGGLADLAAEPGCLTLAGQSVAYE